MERSFRFGVQTKLAESATAWTDLARRAEDLGYDVLTLPDHFDGQLAPGPALAAAATVTDALRLGTMVYANDYRHPVVLASEASTLDLLSDGRLELGVGAGWMTTDYEAAGLGLDRPGVRIDRLAETIEILNGLFAPGSFSFNGQHYTVTDLDLQPKPVQAPRPPLFIGGGGPRMLAMAAKQADIVGINANLASGAFDAATVADATAERIAEKVKWVRSAAGERWPSVELQARVHFVVFTDDPAGTAEMLGGTVGLSGEQALGSPLGLFGSAASMSEDLLERRERYGFSYITVGADVMEEFAPVVSQLHGA